MTNLLACILCIAGLITIFFAIKYFLYTRPSAIQGFDSSALLAIYLFGINPLGLGILLFKFSKSLKVKEKEREALELELFEARKIETLHEWKSRFPNHWQSMVNEKLELGMTLEMVSIFLSKKGLVTSKEIVTKDRCIENHYFGGRWSSTKRDFVYYLEVTIEKGKVVGWKNL